MPARGIGDVTMERLVAHARALEVPLAEAMARAASFEDLPPGAATHVAAFLDVTTNYYEHTGTQTVARSLITRAVGEV